MKYELIESEYSIVQPISIANGNECAIIWVDSRHFNESNSEIYFRRINNLGESISSDIRVTDIPYSVADPEIIFSPMNKYALAWVDARNGYSNTKFTYLSLQGEKEFEEISISSRLEEQSSPLIVINHTGQKVFVIFKTGVALATSILDNEGNILVKDSIFSMDGSVTSEPAGTLNEMGVVATVWADSRDGNSQIYFAKIKDDGSLF